MKPVSITKRDRWMAGLCRTCLVCSRARQHPQGLAAWFVEKVENRVCPFCRAYEKVYGHKAHESLHTETALPPKPGSADIPPTSKL